jgi:hypothetical protein
VSGVSPARRAAEARRRRRLDTGPAALAKGIDNGDKASVLLLLFSEPVMELNLAVPGREKQGKTARKIIKNG